MKASVALFGFVSVPIPKLNAKVGALFLNADPMHSSNCEFISIQLLLQMFKVFSVTTRLVLIHSDNDIF